MKQQDTLKTSLRLAEKLTDDEIYTLTVLNLNQISPYLQFMNTLTSSLRHEKRSKSALKIPNRA